MAIFALANPTYQPAMRIISAITKSKTAVITTTFDHDYVTGTIVRLFIPDGFGMTQADKREGVITVTGPTTFSIDIDTTRFDTFAMPALFPDSFQRAHVVPIGERTNTLAAATMNVLT